MIKLQENRFYIHELENGIRIIFQNTGKSAVISCGLVVNAGTRDEDAGKEGVAHFIEHMLFKGTKNRRSIHILNRLEMVGGELNAYTTKEETCIYASCMKNYFDRAVELIADVVFNSTFPEKEMVKEKEVVLDEIRTYLDNPSEQIFDDFEELVFAKHPLGNSILGTTKSVANFKRNDLLNFMKQNYFTDRMVFSVTGDLSFEDVKQTVQKYFSAAKKTLHQREQKKFSRYTPKHRTEHKTTEQAHYITGNVAFSYNNPQRITMVLLNNILGGPAMNSKLNLAIREKYGYTYNIESNYLAFRDTGIFNLYLATEKKYLERTVELVHKELKKFCEIKFKDSQLLQYKNQLMGQIALSQENKAGIMLGIGKALLNYNKVDSLDEIFKKIEKITPLNILEISNRVFDRNKMSSLLFTNS